MPKGIPFKIMPWTEEEDRLLSKLYLKHGIRYIAVQLGRGHSNVSERVRVLGMKCRRNTSWTDEEMQILREAFPKDGASKVLQDILRRTANSICVRAQRCGIKQIGKEKRKWTTTELEIMVTRYPFEGVSEELQISLPNRTKNSIAGRANIMGLFVSTDIRSKIQTEISQVGKYNRSFKGYEDLPGHFISSIRQDARKRNIVHPLLDGSKESNQYLWDLYVSQDKRCSLTGYPICFCRSYSKKNDHRSGSASLDRINSLEGYVVGNVQWVHKHVNLMKRSLSQEEFIGIANQIAKKHPRL